VRQTHRECSDENTGLVPLNQLDPQHSILLTGWDVTEGVVQVHGEETEAVRTLHVGGLVQGDQPGQVEWAQFFVSVPVNSLLDVSADLAKGSVDTL